MSAPVIKIRTIDSVADGAIRMGGPTTTGGYFARKILGLPANWSKIRIGCLIHMTDSGANLSGQPIFAVGLSSGTDHPYGSATATHFCGMFTNFWNNNSRQAGYYGSIQLSGRKVVGVTTTDSAALAAAFTTFGNGAEAAAPNNNDLTILFCDITWGNPNYSIQAFFNNMVPPIPGTTKAVWLMNMQAGTPQGLATYVYTGPQTVAVNETVDGTFNSVNFFWDNNEAAIELTDIGVSVLALR